MNQYNGYFRDTIAAVSTAVSEAGIGIIRISGPDAVRTADQACRLGTAGKVKISDVPSHTIHYGFVMDEGEVIDEVLISVMRAPRSFTAEDVVEINCHGGVFALKRCLETVLKCGARAAEPGEFTKRAFLNGRIGLSQAEAVMDIIQAKGEMALKSSLSQLKGSVQKAVSSLRGAMLEKAAFMEAALDDPEHYSLDGFSDELLECTSGWMDSLKKLLRDSANGRMVREGIRTAIIGKPNAGKSSLLNCLADEQVAIVTDIAGTTRDIVSQTLRIGDIVLEVSDTAGIRDSSDTVEKIGVERAVSCAMESDLILYVADASLPVDEWDRKILEIVREKPLIALLNKSDLSAAVSPEQISVLTGKNTVIIPISALEGTGIDRLKTAIKEMFYHGDVSFNDELIITNARHLQCLEHAMDSLVRLEEGLNAGVPEDICCIDLTDAITFLGDITGESMRDDLIDEIFGKFCMGK